MMTKIEQLRKTLNLTQKELAQKIGVSESAISAYESRRRSPCARILKNLSFLLNKIEPPLGLTIEDILMDYK